MKNHNGSIARCLKCNVIQVYFGNFIMTMNDASFMKIYNLISNTRLQNLGELEARDQKIITINTQAEGLYLALSLVDVNNFCDLLQEAKFLMEVEKIAYKPL
ncbi:MAG: hypothetical protein KDD32_01095 [Bacteroidetes bacterium]|nr:hypothetical protein [Bacteroidota bacterium]